VKPALAAKKTKLLKRVAGFKGYHSRHCRETDWLLRKHLANEVEKIRDRLADIMVNRQEPDPLREKFSYSLKTLAYLKAELSPAELEEGLATGLSPAVEELVMDADLILLEKVEGLHTPLDEMEGSGPSDRIEAALSLFDEGLAEVDDQFQLRRRLCRNRTPA